VIVVLGLFDELRPTVTVDDVSGPLSMTTVIELVMFTAALVILLWNRVPPAVVVDEPLAAVNIDKTGTTRLSKVPIWHSFTIPMLVSWVVVVFVGLLIARLLF
jgi:anaerobic C4-dicarboxylate transporter